MKHKKKLIGLTIFSAVFVAIFAFALVNLSQLQNLSSIPENQVQAENDVNKAKDANTSQITTSQQNSNDNNLANSNDMQKQTQQGNSATTQSSTNKNNQETKENEIDDNKLPFAGPNANEEDYDEIVASMQKSNLTNRNYTDTIFYKVDDENNPSTLNISGKETTGYKSINRDSNDVPEWFQYNDKVKTIIIDNEIDAQCAKCFFGVLDTPGKGTKTSKVTSIQNLNYLKLSNCKDTSYMFAGIGFNDVPVTLTGTWSLDTEGDYAGYLNLSNVTNSYAMFCCTNINCGFSGEVKIATSEALENPSCMFQSAGDKFVATDMSKFTMSDTEGVDLDTSYMLNKNLKLQTIEGSASIDVSKLANARSMFCECPQLASLDLTKWTNNPQDGASFVNMFRACPKLKTINVVAYTDWRNVDGRMMFAANDEQGSSFEGCLGTTWNKDFINQDRAVVDLGIGISEDGTAGTTPGYFTATTMKAIGPKSQSNDASTMTFYFDNINHEKGTSSVATYDVWPRFENADKVSWKNIRESIGNVAFDDSMNQEATGLISTSYWFYGFNNEAFTNINIKKLNVDNIEWCVSMFEGCSNLKTIVSESYYADDDHNYDPWNLTYPAQGVNMFKGCTSLIGGNGTQSQGKEDYNYARSDQVGRPGLFTFGGNEKDPSYIVYTATYLYQYNNQNLYTQKIVAGQEVKIAGANNEAYSAIKDIADKQNKTVMYWYKGSTKYNPTGETETTQSGADTTTTINGKIGFAVDKPSEESYDYNKNPQSPTWAGKTGLTLSGTTSATNAGTYPVIASPAADYCWTNGGKASEDSIDVDWYINPLKVSEPGHTNRTYNFDSQSTWTSTPNEGLTVSGTASATNKGSYTAYLTPKTPNYTWEDGSTTQHTINWSISALAMKTGTSGNTTVATVADNTSWKGSAAANPVVTVSGHSLATTSSDLVYTNTGNTPATADPWSCTNKFTITGQNNLSGTVYSNQYTETRATMTLEYNANGGSGTAPASKSTRYGIKLSVTTSDGYWCTQSDKTKGVATWNTKSDGSGTSTVPTVAYSWSGKSNVTLYAQWGAKTFRAIRSSGNLTFYYDAWSHGGTEYTGIPTNISGDLTEDEYKAQIPWYSTRKSITGTVSFNSTCKDYTSLKSMAYWFGSKTDTTTNCCMMTSFDGRNLNVSNVTNMRSLFSECKILKTIDLTGWNTSKVTNMRSMFYVLTSTENASIKKIYVDSNWKVNTNLDCTNDLKNNDPYKLQGIIYPSGGYWAYDTKMNGVKTYLRIATPSAEGILTDYRLKAAIEGGQLDISQMEALKSVDPINPNTSRLDNAKTKDTDEKSYQENQNANVESTLPPSQYTNKNNTQQKVNKTTTEQFPK